MVLNMINLTEKKSGKNNKNKKAQLTVFIIIGIVLLLILGLTLYFTQSMFFQKLFVPKEISKVVVFTEACVQAAAEEGLFLLSIQGGYIEQPDYITKDPYSYVDAGFKVPYLYYRGNDRAPSKTQMEFELVNYVNEQVKNCINNYDMFRNEYEFTEIKQIQTTVKIADQVVAVTTTIPLQLKQKSSDSAESSGSFKKLPPVSVVMKSAFGAEYDLARSIMYAENQDAFLEELSNDMIAVSPDIPYTGLELTCEPRMWTIDELEEYVKNLILYNMRYLHFENVQGIKSGIDYYEKQYQYKVSNKKYPDLKVNVIYDPKWDFDLEVSPSKNGVVRPIEYTASESIFTCFKIYNHHYSYTYPIMFQIIDTKHPDQEFYFATPVIVKRNLPNRHNEVPPWKNEFDLETNQEYCDTGYEEVTDYQIDPDGNIITEKTTIPKNKHTLRVVVHNDGEGNGFSSLLSSTDKFSNEFSSDVLHNASISYQCVNFKCDIGRTDYPREEGKLAGVIPELSAEFPACEGGVIITEREGFLKAYQQQSVNAQTENYNIIINMKPLKNFNVHVKIIEEKNGLIEERDLREGEYAYILLENKDLLYEEQVFYPSELHKTITLIEDEITYNLDIKLFDETTLLGTASMQWNPQVDHILNRGGIVFYVYKKDIPSYIDDQKQRQEAIEYAEEKSKEYQPRLTLS